MKPALKGAVAVAVVLLVVGADRPELARLAAWVAVGVATMLLYRAVRW